jgi:hypothetical protein
MTGWAVPPSWRKATRNMTMSVRSMDLALLQAPMALERGRARMGLVVGTVSGELETSAEFISTLAQTGMARPLLFQNSLHNATSGFASIHFGLTGAAFTISDGARTPGEALHLAGMLIRENICAVMLVTLVEVHKLMAGYTGQTIPEGACTLLLSSEEVAAELQSPFVPLEEKMYAPYEPEADHQPLLDVTRSEFYRTAKRLHGPVA